MKIGLFLPNWIGNVVMATPAVRAIRHHFGSEATLYGILRPYTAEVLAGLPWLDECLCYDPRSRDPAQTTLALVRELRRRRWTPWCC